MAVTPLLFAFYFIEEEKPLGMWISALLALSVKEEIALLVFMLGLYTVLFRKIKMNNFNITKTKLIIFRNGEVTYD